VRTGSLKKRKNRNLQHEMSILVMGISSILECEKAGLLVYIFLTERWYIVLEENRLTAAFGKRHNSYQMRTCRWL